MTNLLKQIVRDTRGATAVEYGLILSLVFIAMLTGVKAFSASTNEMWTTVATIVGEKT